MGKFRTLADWLDLWGWDLDGCKTSYKDNVLQVASIQQSYGGRIVIIQNLALHPVDVDQYQYLSNFIVAEEYFKVLRDVL